MQNKCNYKITFIEARNEDLRKQIDVAKKQREEACVNAKRLAEENFHLENHLCDICMEIHELKVENERLIKKKQHV